MEFDPEIGKFFGRITNIREVVTFYGESVDDLQKEFQASLEVYLDFCREKGIEAAKPYSGKLNLGLGPGLHRQVAAAAAAASKSINAWIVEAIARQTDQS